MKKEEILEFLNSIGKECIVTFKKDANSLEVKASLNTEINDKTFISSAIGAGISDLVRQGVFTKEDVNMLANAIKDIICK